MTRTRSLLTPARFGPARPWDDEAVTHLLRRAAFGHSPRERQELQEAGPAEAVERLLQGAPPEARAQRVSELRDAALRSENPEDFGSWLLLSWLSTPHPLRARMQLFWHDHFATGVSKVRSSFWMSQQFAAFEEHGLGSFEELLGAVARTPAMLRWLDNEENRKGRANENFARELFELFTLGLGAYGEKDIQEAARAFTGWRIANERFFFDRRRHDDGEKEVLGVRGRLTGEDVLRIACAQPACPRFLARKLLGDFVGPDVPGPAVDELASVLRESGLNVGAALRVLLRSELFFDARYRGARIRSPVEWILWTLRSLESRASPRELHRAAKRMGQELLEPPDVSGWPGGTAWISTSTWVQRSNFANELAIPQGRYRLRPRLDSKLPRPSEEQILELQRRLFPEGLAEETLDELRQQLAQERPHDRHTRAAGLLAAFLNLPAAHRC